MSLHSFLINYVNKGFDLLLSGNQGIYSQAIEFYEKFLDQFPEHKLAKDVEQNYAKALHNEPKPNKTTILSTPREEELTGDGSTVVKIRNISPVKIRIIFDGPTLLVKVLEPCQSCQKSPKACLGNIPLGSYAVPPGQYKVIVKSIGDDKVTPYIGSWMLSSNTSYNECFSIQDGGFLSRLKKFMSL
ncbi:hypothetical protein HRE53_31225 (plasmid) [Acaryochloris sp. 'Moss Beach']|uniref:tetratricopeptide repeat protein n=1 Tax=Acaryochloris sp. 'Moss Beach' TaxID=2740837 RepID=UPI001F388B90|nr:hypothetical protein [Acaryochloris sp. 'Moss Beach']UJB73060.1 hypothetical protein HRE53_31225 [Acaryochloris sp. 'Moss Beach']